MATLTLKGVNRTRWATTVPSDKIPAGEQHGKVHIMYDQYTWATDSVIADVVTLMQIPKGARVIDAVVKSNDNGTAGQYDIGYAVSADAVEVAVVDAFFNEFNPEGTGGNVASMSGGGLAAGTGVGAIAPGTALHKSFAAPCDVTVTVTEASNVGSGVTISMVVYYVLD